MNSSAPNKEALSIAGPVGRIEALLEVSGSSSAMRVGVVYHPHSLYQGTMMNKVVHTIARAMNDLGVPAIRFNFRGVGVSEGRYADGIGATDDTTGCRALGNGAVSCCQDLTRRVFLWRAGLIPGCSRNRYGTVD